jgi:Tfp pilus assembly protein PilV
VTTPKRPFSALRALSPSGGFGLAELTIAMAVLLIGVLSVAALFSSGYASIRRASATTTASALAASEMERLRAIHWDSIGLDDTQVLAAAAPYSSHSAYRSTASQRVALPACGGGADPCTNMVPTKAAAGADGKSYRVDTYVTWQDVTGGRQVKLVTIAVRDGSDSSKIWAQLASSFDGAEPQPPVDEDEGPNEAPVVDNPGTRNTRRSASVTLLLSASDPNGDPVTWTATGLPAGLTLNAALGRITGAPTTVGTYNVTVRASDGELTGSATFTWSVVSGSGAIELAGGKTAVQSSTASGDSGAANAVDGSTNGTASNGSVAATNTQSEPYWQVDLGAIQAIGQVVVYKQTSPSFSFGDFYVIASPSPFTSADLEASLQQTGVRWFHISADVGTTSTINLNETGRYLRVQRAGSSESLKLAEVQVFAP